MAEFILHDIDISGLIKAKFMLDNAIKIANSPLEKTGAIQCFEYCYEISWKIMRKILLKDGIEVNNGSRAVFREAAINKLIDNAEVWFDFVIKRNLTSHTYDHDLAEEIFNFLPHFQHELDKFITRIKNL